MGTEIPMKGVFALTPEKAVDRSLFMERPIKKGLNRRKQRSGRA
jgi:hypothetical protein